MQLHDITASATSEASKIEAAYTTYGISKTAVCQRNTSYLHLPLQSDMVLSGPNMGRVHISSILADCVLGQCRYV